MKATVNEISFSDADVVNLDNWIPAGESNSHNVRPFLLHDHGFVLCIVFADCLQDAIDEATDAGKLDRFKIAQADFPDYLDDGDISYLGNACEAFDIANLEFIELKNPPRSFVGQFVAAFGEVS